MSTFRPLDPFDCELDGINLIEASAGTGKTWNLCWLFLRLLLERGLDIRQILVVTFTHAATAELRDRIRSRLVETRRHLERGATGERDPFIGRLLDSLRERQPVEVTDTVRISRIDAALGAFDDASIFTIHGFCQRALSDAAFAAGMPIRTEVLTDESALLQQSVNDFWRRRIASGELPDALLDWMMHRGDTPERLAQALRQHLDQPLAQRLWPRAPTGTDTPGSVLADKGLVAAHQRAAAIWRARRETIVEAVRKALSCLHGNTYKEKTLLIAIAEWEAILGDDDVRSMLRSPTTRIHLLGIEQLRKSTRSKCITPDHEFFEAAQVFIDRRKERIHHLDLVRLGLLRELLEHCTRSLDAEKRRLRAVSFNDMLRNLHERLQRDDSDWLVALLRERFPAAMIDEFQDTDPLQFGIFERIYSDGAGPLFLVGDPKQSIYRFRHADLHTYLSARSRASRHYTLEHNQRSGRDLIEALNRLFGSNRALFMFEGLDYRDAQVGDKPRKSLNDQSGPAAALELWMLPGTAGEGQRVGIAEGRRLSAQACAGEIRRLLAASADGQVRIGEQPLRASDIAVLVRSHNDAASIRRELESLGVGCVERSQRSIYSTRDAEEIEWILEATLEPSREARVRAALATEAMGLDAGAIAALDRGEPAQCDWTAEFALMRQQWLERGIGFMLRCWMMNHKVISRLLARPDGERRLTNLLHLAECLQAASAGEAGADALLNWLREQRKRADRDEAAQLRLESDENLVQVVTIHASKGLEYPVVFCPFLWTPAIRLDPTPWGVGYHDEAGQAILDYRKDLDAEYGKDSIDALRRLESAADFIRLVYVALTRAIHRCVLVAGSHLGQNSDKPATRGLLNWIVAGEGVSPDEWLKKKPEVKAEHVDRAWRALGEGSTGIRVTMLPNDACGTPLPRDSAGLAPHALENVRRLAIDWRIGSYSQLALGATSDAAASDHDARIRSGPRSGNFDTLATDDILRFPAGAASGTCLHRVLETIDFCDASDWDTAIDAALASLPGRGNGRSLPRADGARMIGRMLVDLLDTPLPLGTANPLVLRKLPRGRRLDELEFHLPCRQLRAKDLNALLARHGYPVLRPEFRTLEGFLKGFIDLVLEHEGRYFIVDWKSNHLGMQAADYARDPLHEAMLANTYHLQYLLYSVALDRYLRSRLADYQLTTHFGGVAYLFLRGVRPGWKQADGSPAGLYFDRPDPGVIESLSALLDAGGGVHG